MRFIVVLTVLIGFISSVVLAADQDILLSSASITLNLHNSSAFFSNCTGSLNFFVKPISTPADIQGTFIEFYPFRIEFVTDADYYMQVIDMTDNNVLCSKIASDLTGMHSVLFQPGEVSCYITQSGTPTATSPFAGVTSQCLNPTSPFNISSPNVKGIIEVDTLSFYNSQLSVSSIELLYLPGWMNCVFQTKATGAWLFNEITAGNTFSSESYTIAFSNGDTFSQASTVSNPVSPFPLDNQTCPFCLSTSSVLELIPTSGGSVNLTFEVPPITVTLNDVLVTTLFGNADCNQIGSSPSTGYLNCSLPSGVGVSNVGSIQLFGGFLSCGFSFSYQPPSVTSHQPVESSDTLITISGSNFGSISNEVILTDGASNFTCAIVISNTQVTCSITPSSNNRTFVLIVGGQASQEFLVSPIEPSLSPSNSNSASLSTSNSVSSSISSSVLLSPSLSPPLLEPSVSVSRFRPTLTLITTTKGTTGKRTTTGRRTTGKRTTGKRTTTGKKPISGAFHLNGLGFTSALFIVISLFYATIGY